MAQKRILSQHFALGEIRNDAKYYIEEYRKKKWREVSGPYDTKTEADDEAIQYSKDHPGVQVRVVVYH